MTAKLLCTLAAAAVCLLLVWIAGSLMLSPVKCGKNSRQMVLLLVQGREPALEHNVRGLLWLNDNGVLRCRIIILGNALDEETRFVARALAREHSCITLIEDGETPPWIWKTN